MSAATKHRITSAIIYYFAFGLGLPLIAMIAILPSMLVSGDWGIVVMIVSVLIGLGIGIMLFGKLRRWRTNKFYRIYFPTFRGERVPAYSLIGFRSGIDDVDLPQSVPTIACLSEEEMFFLNLINPKRMHEANGGELMEDPSGEGFWSFKRDEIISIDVIERSDEAIKASAVDTRSDGERFAEGAAAHLLGVKVKQTVVPFVAYLVVTADDPTLPGLLSKQIIFAIPSEIEPEAFEYLGVKFDSDEGSALIDAASKYVAKKAEKELKGAGENIVRDLIGDDTVDFADEVVDIQNDIQFLVNLGSAKIGSTDGARGRVMARLIAERLRAWSNLPTVGVSTL